MDHKKAALITGGAEGIGACTASLLANHGYSVFFCDINREKGTIREKALRKEGLDATFIQCDVSDPDSVREMSVELRKRVSSLDLIVNNAGIADPIMEFPADDISGWSKVIETNLSGQFYVVNFLLGTLKEGSCIVMISSTRALQSEPNTLAYSASKGGVASLTHSLAMTLSDRRIRAVSIMPGWIDTSRWKIPERESNLSRLDHEQHPSKRVGTPEDVAGMIRFLASDEGSWINGESIVIDGGMTRRMVYFDDDVVDEALRLRNAND